MCKIKLKSQAGIILGLTKNDFDPVINGLNLWTYMALSAVLYGAEVIKFSQEDIKQTSRFSGSSAGTKKFCFSCSYKKGNWSPTNCAINYKNESQLLAPPVHLSKKLMAECCFQRVLSSNNWRAEKPSWMEIKLCNRNQTNSD